MPVLWQAEEQGLCFALSLADDDTYWQLAAYLDQLFEEDFVSQLSDRWLLPWDALYQLLADPEHASSLPLLSLPPLAELQPQLASKGGLADGDFSVSLTWRNPASGAAVEIDRLGALARHGSKTELCRLLVGSCCRPYARCMPLSKVRLEKRPISWAGRAFVNRPSALTLLWMDSSTKLSWSSQRACSSSRVNRWWVIRR